MKSYLKASFCGPLVFQRSLLLLSAMFVALIALVLSGCVSTVRFTPVDYCKQPVDPKMARIVVSRNSSMVGGGAGMRIFDNDQPIGDVGSGEKLCWDRYPGVSVITIGVHGKRTKNKTVAILTKPNKTYIVGAGFGWAGQHLEIEEKSN